MKTIQRIRSVARWVPAVLLFLALGMLVQGCAREANALENGVASNDGSTNPPGDDGSMSPPPADPPAQDPVPPPQPEPEPDPVSIQLAWNASLLSADGSALTDLAGYRVHQGSAAGQYDFTSDVGNVTTFTTHPLGAGTYYFAVTALDSSGNESRFSSEVSAIVQ